MNFSGGFVQVRRGVLEHLYSGKLNPTQFQVFVMMILLADKATGIWKGSAPALITISGDSLKLKTVRDAMRSLETDGYIRRDYVQGKLGNFPILIDKYLVTTGKLKGQRLSVAATTDCSQPVYEIESETVSEGVSEGVSETVCEEVRVSIPQIPKTSRPQER
jgi:hypothetical protein